MQEIDTLQRQLDYEENIPAILAKIIDLIFDSIGRRHESLDTWEKMHFANAIGSLELSVHSPQLLRAEWLRLCLSDLRQALTPKTERHSDFVIWDMNEDLSPEQLLEILASVAQSAASTE